MPKRTTAQRSHAPFRAKGDASSGREPAAGFDVPFVRAELGELRAEERHAAVVDLAHHLGDRPVAPRPVPEGEFDLEQLPGRRCHSEKLLELVPSVPRPGRIRSPQP